MQLKSLKLLISLTLRVYWSMKIKSKTQYWHFIKSKEYVSITLNKNK